MTTSAGGREEGGAGGAARTGRDGYYEGLDRSAWSPPSEVVSPVWSALCLTVAAWPVAREGLGRPAVRVALALGLNAAWTPIFFAAERPGGP